MSAPRDYGELSNDEKFIKVVENFDKCLDQIDASLQAAVEVARYDEMSTSEKVKFDNYLAYTINSLYWMYVKLQGQDPNEHGIKNELKRVRATMLRDKEIHEHKTIRPVIDKNAANRFIKHGLNIRFDETSEKQEEDH